MKTNHYLYTVMVKSKYDSGINIIGSIPDTAEMINYINSQSAHTVDNGFRFRSEKSTKRFVAAISAHILRFHSSKHRRLFMSALASEEFSLPNKYLIVFWQLTYSNLLFRRITEEVFMKAVYQGRSALASDEVLSFLHFLKETEKTSINWSEMTLKILSSKYLTLLKKLGLAEGTVRKQIIHPIIPNELFVYFIRWTQAVCPEDRTLLNPFIKFGFCDNDSLITRLKKVDNISYWDITQIGTDITIDIKDDDQ